MRAVVVSSSNPLRSFADTYAWEKAFDKLDLKVTIDIAMTETAELSDYVLPARSPYESYDSAFFTWNYPEIYFQMRHPVIEPSPGTKESGLILAEIAESAGIVPDLPDYLYSAARKDRTTFTTALLTYIQKNPKYRRHLPLIVAKVRAGFTESNNLDALWGIFLASPSASRKNASRAGYPMPTILQAAGSFGKWIKVCKAMLKYKSLAPLAVLTPQVAHAHTLFETVLKSRSGLWVGKVGENNMKALRTKDQKIDLYIEEMEKWIAEISPEAEKKALLPDSNYPFILNAGRHTPQNANNLMRKPDWNKGRRTCTLAMNPADAGQLGVIDGEFVKVTTEAASERIELEISEDVRPGQVLIPHGFGLKHKGVTHGIAVNRLTKNSHRDRLAATPIHRYVPCRVEKDDPDCG